MTPMAEDDRIVDLEIRMSFLERHLEEIDKVVLEVRDQLDAFQRELASLRQQQLGEAGKLEDEVPPHY